MMESILGRDEQQQAVEETARGKLRAEVMKRAALGGGWTVGIAVVYGAWDLLRSNPNQAFPLLQAWGARTLISIAAIWVAYDIVKICLSIAKRGVIAMEKTAVALQRIGDKDDRQLQELQTLTSYTSQQSERHSTLLRSLAEGMTGVNDKLDRLLSAGGGNR